MKKLLMLQSLSPLVLLTVIRNFSFCVSGNDGEEIVLGTWTTLFLKSNLVLIIIFFLCFVWVIAAVWSFIKFTAFKWVDKKSGYQVINIEEKEDTSLNFFMTMIIPLLIDDVGSIQGAITFIIIIVMMCTLLERTNLFYQHVYSVSRIDRSRNILAFFNGHKTYDEIKDDVIQINSRVDFLIMGDSIFSSKIELLQKYFEFEKYIRSGAKRTIELISRMDIVTDLEKFFAVENKVK